MLLNHFTCTDGNHSISTCLDSFDEPKLCIQQTAANLYTRYQKSKVYLSLVHLIYLTGTVYRSINQRKDTLYRTITLRASFHLQSLRKEVEKKKISHECESSACMSKRRGADTLLCFNQAVVLNILIHFLQHSVRGYQFVFQLLAASFFSFSVKAHSLSREPVCIYTRL